MENDDFSCRELAFFLNNRSAHYDRSDDYEKKYPQDGPRWWADQGEGMTGGQKLHLIFYLGSCWELEGRNKNSVKHVWAKNGFNNAAGLIWLLEALGADDDVVAAAYEAGKNAAEKGGKQPAQSSAIKDAVTWETVKALCEKNGIRKLRPRSSALPR